MSVGPTVRQRLSAECAVCEMIRSCFPVCSDVGRHVNKSLYVPKTGESYEYSLCRRKNKPPEANNEGPAAG